MITKVIPAAQPAVGTQAVDYEQQLVEATEYLRESNDRLQRMKAAGLFDKDGDNTYPCKAKGCWKATEAEIDRFRMTITIKTTTEKARMERGRLKKKRAQLEEKIALIDSRQ